MYLWKCFLFSSSDTSDHFGKIHVLGLPSVFNKAVRYRCSLRRRSCIRRFFRFFSLTSQRSGLKRAIANRLRPWSPFSRGGCTQSENKYLRYFYVTFYLFSRSFVHISLLLFVYNNRGRRVWNAFSPCRLLGRQWLSLCDPKTVRPSLNRSIPSCFVSTLSPRSFVFPGSHLEQSTSVSYFSHLSVYTSIVTQFQYFHR